MDIYKSAAEGAKSKGDDRKARMHERIIKVHSMHLNIVRTIFKAIFFSKNMFNAYLNKASDILKDTVICDAPCILGSVLLFGVLISLNNWCVTHFILTGNTLCCFDCTTIAYFTYQNNLL